MVKENNDSVLSIGAKVLSTDFSIGIISAIEKVGEDDYYVIQYGSARSKNFFPIKGNTKIRAVSSKDEFEELIKVFKGKRKIEKFESKKAREVYFERQLDRSSLSEIITRVSELNPIADRSVKEKKIIERMIETLEFEASVIFDMSVEESKKYISDFLK